jgi:hypothetical protein
VVATLYSEPFHHQIDPRPTHECHLHWRTECWGTAIRIEKNGRIWRHSRDSLRSCWIPPNCHRIGQSGFLKFTPIFIEFNWIRRRLLQWPPSSSTAAGGSRSALHHACFLFGSRLPRFNLISFKNSRISLLNWNLAKVLWRFRPHG